MLFVATIKLEDNENDKKEKNRFSHVFVVIACISCIPYMLHKLFYNQLINVLDINYQMDILMSKSCKFAPSSFCSH